MVPPEGLEPSTHCLRGSCSSLRYGGVWSELQDSNLRPPARKAGALIQTELSSVVGEYPRNRTGMSWVAASCLAIRPDTQEGRSPEGDESSVSLSGCDLLWRIQRELNPRLRRDKPVCYRNTLNPKMVDVTGLEPATFRVQTGCSPN